MSEDAQQRKRKLPAESSAATSKNKKSKKKLKMPSPSQIKRRLEMCDMLWSNGISFDVVMQSQTMTIDPVMQRITTTRRFTDASECQMMWHAALRSVRGVRICMPDDDTSVIDCLARRLVEKWRRVAPEKSAMAFYRTELKSLLLAEDLRLGNAFRLAAAAETSNNTK